MDHRDRYYIGTGAVAAQFGVTIDTVRNWMLTGVPIQGERVRLQYHRIGEMFKTTQEWVDEFDARCNANTPPITETTAQAKRRAARDKARYQRERAL